ncbi:hypothetical protein FHR95_003152 [Halomonas fontilapidosi]|uniref:Uncharacterized protein n=1 Tax=Halomonas fontilapidosi TaxID=616675 RepID=A0A7W5DMD0_9GAMM|nr:hypothetical protein [Halomonas fontilapidosi]MBB3185562.1 hypothetical protein [Halomonas fontilapidosi]
MTPLRALWQSLCHWPLGQGLVGAMALGYGGLYLWLTGDLGGGGSGVLQATFPAWERVWETRSPFYFEPVGLIEAGPLVWTFSPVNTLFALGLGLLLGTNLVLAWRLRRVSRACGWQASGSTFLSGLPALLAGGACCAPLVLIWLGLPLAGALASITPWLIPLATLLLLASLAYLAMALASSAS